MDYQRRVPGFKSCIAESIFLALPGRFELFLDFRAAADADLGRLVMAGAVAEDAVCICCCFCTRARSFRDTCGAGDAGL